MSSHDQNFTVIAVALDESPDDVRPWTDGITLPVLIDPQHVLTEVYAISNVPAVVWIDEDDHIVRPTGVAFSNDMFKEFTGAESGPHLDAVRAWVRDGTVPMTDADARAAVPDLSDDEVLARLHFRVGVEARRRGDDATLPPSPRARRRARAHGLHHPPGRDAAARRRPVRRASSWSCTPSGRRPGARSTASRR